MDQDRKQKKSPLTVAAKPTRVNTCCTIVVNSVMLGFFGIYAFNNPDYNSSTDTSCYVTKIDGELQASPFEIDESSTDVGFEFFAIFLSGFTLCLINLLYAAVAIFYFMYANKKLLHAASCLVCMSGALTIGWMVYTSVVIFGDKGQLCRSTYAH